jgi:hypothetical protein
MIKQSNDEEIKNTLLKDRSLSLILYVLSETPSYHDELLRALKLPRSVVLNALLFLIKNGLIRDLKIDDVVYNDVVKEFFPIIMQKQKKAVKGLSQIDARDVLKRINYYFISPRGLDFLPYARRKIFQLGGEKK